MVKKMSKKEKQKRLKEVLSIYGANPSHWPDDERVELLAVANSSGDVSAFVRGAREIDLVLDSAPKLEMPQGAIGRLKTAVGISGNEDKDEVRVAEPNAEIIKFSSRKMDQAEPPHQNRRDIFAAVTAIAACLVLGVLVGTSQLAEQYLPIETIIASNDVSVSEDGNTCYWSEINNKFSTKFMYDQYGDKPSAIIHDELSYISWNKLFF